MNIYKRYDKDQDAEVNGVWIDFGDGAQIKIARFGHKEHAEVIKRLQKPYQAILRVGGSIPEDKQTEIAIESMAQAIVRDWRGIKDADNSDIPFNLDNVRKVLGDLEDLRNLIAQVAMEAETYRKETLEAAGKPLPTPSDGTANGESPAPSPCSGPELKAD